MRKTFVSYFLLFANAKLFEWNNKRRSNQFKRPNKDHKANFCLN